MPDDIEYNELDIPLTDLPWGVPDRCIMCDVILGDWEVLDPDGLLCDDCWEEDMYG